MPRTSTDISKAAGGACVRCGGLAERSCFLYSSRAQGGAASGGLIEDDTRIPYEHHDIEAERFFVCERCIARSLWRRRYIGFSAAGILFFLGAIALLSPNGSMRVLGIALVFAGMISVGWAILNTVGARDDAVHQIAREEATSRAM